MRWLALILWVGCDTSPHPQPATVDVPLPALTPISARDKQAALKYKPSSGAQRSGAVRLLGKPAPELQIGRWTEGDRPPPTMAGSRGKVIVVFAFQGW